MKNDHLISDDLIKKTEEFVLKSFEKDASGHDFFHIQRVVLNARKICRTEQANERLVILSAWLHDVGDYKLHDGIDRSEELITAFLQKENTDNSIIEKVIKIVSEVSFSKGNIPGSIEAKIVQDADRLDAIGAIGIARCFAYGGSSGNLIYNPYNQSKNSSSIQHFYDKLLILKDLMHTETARSIAEKRHNFMELYLKEFYTEVN